MTNQDRCSAKIARTVKDYQNGASETNDTAIVDMLADIRHYCDKHELSFGELDDGAHEHYMEESMEDRREARLKRHNL